MAIRRARIRAPALFSPFVTESLDSTTQKLHVANPRVTAWRAAAMKASLAKLHSREIPYLSLHALEDGSGWYVEVYRIWPPQGVILR